MSFDLGAFLGSIVSATGLGIGHSKPATGSAAANQILEESKQLGVSPLALLGNAPTTGNSPVVGDVGTSGQLLARAFQADKPANDRLEALKEQNLALQNAQLQNDVIAGQMRNSIHRTAFGQPGSPPPRGEVYGPFWPVGIERPKNELQAVVGPNGKVTYLPSAATQQGAWSPLPAMSANPSLIADVTRANAGNMPLAPDIARMSGLPPGAYPFVPGTAPFSWSNFLPDWR